MASGTNYTPFPVEIPVDAKFILLTVGTIIVASSCSGPFNNITELVVKDTSENGNIFYETTNSFYVKRTGIIHNKLLRIGYDINSKNLESVIGFKNSQTNNVSVYYLS